jgi:hypothetical protein
MTGWGVERSTRTAYPVSAPPADVSALMPPSSQGAERRTERRAGRTGSRWALRALVIGGLAGAAWLLTGAAAHAADHASATETSSLIGAVVDGVTAPPAVTKVLKAAAQPLESDRTAHRVSSSVMAAPARVLTRPAEVLTETLDEATPENNAVTRVVRDLTGPLRLTGGPADTRQLAPVAAPLTTTLAPVTDLLQHEQEPAAEPDDAPGRDDVPGKAPGRTAPGSKPAVTPATGDAAATRTADTAPVHGTGTHGSVSKRHATVGHPHPTTVTAMSPDTVRDSTPGGDGPAPLQVHLGALSGISTSGPGAPTEGGSAAVLPAAVGGGLVADHRLPRATDVEARRHDAEAPTVSPD